MATREDGPQRALSAIMFADMVGFTALMGSDEEEARRQRDRQRAVVGRTVQRFGGRVLEYYGDGTLSVFGSAVEAARCAAAIQSELREEPRVPLRIGIHTGDVVDEGDGVYGDGVNVAARVESMAPAGGVLVSDKVQDELKNHPDLPTVSLGTVRLKNVSRPVEVFALTASDLPVPGALASVGSPGRLRVGLGVAAGFLLAVFAGLWLWGGSGAPPDPGDRARPSIAVLPFRTLAAESEEAGIFTDGLHDDLLTQLAKVASLEVIARTSVMRFRDTERPLPEIGRELGVATVLEGGVQRSGDRVRLNVQLIDAATDAHLWAETYDRALTAENLFEIQSQLAEAITRELRGVLTGDERRALAGIPTESMAAYDDYLAGSAALRRDGDARDLADAEAAFERAARTDPSFAQAHARLAFVHLNTYWNAWDRSPARLERARVSLERAEALAPGDPEVLMARGYYHYWGFREYGPARTAFAAAGELIPGDARVYEARGYVRRRLGAWREAIEDLRTAVALDPLNPEIIRALAQCHLYLGEYDEAERILGRALALDPGHWSARYDQGLLDQLREGDTGALRAVLADAEQAGVPGGALEYSAWWFAYLDGDQERAFELSGAMAGPVEHQASVHPPALLDALMHERLGDAPAARAAADSARAVLEGLRSARTDDPRVHAALGTALALLGRADEAVREGEEAVRLLSVERDAMDGPEFLLHLARIHALLGRPEEAAGVLERLFALPSAESPASVGLDPAFRALREHPVLTRRLG